MESGDLDGSGEIQDLYKGETVGIPHTDLDACRLRYFGGSSNCWNGWCTAFDPIDFEPRPWVPHSGWPIRFEDIAPYYAPAGEICEVGRQDYGDWIWPKLGLEKPALDETRLKTCHWRKSVPTRFGDRYRSDLADAANITVLLNANAVALTAPSEPNRVTGVSLSSLDGKRGVVRARHYVLACGGIENPRLMLASNDVAPAGLGNTHDQVGRYFMEHPYATSALAISRPVAFLPGPEREIDGMPLDIGFCSAPKLQRDKQVLGSMLLVEPLEDTDHLFSWGRRPLPSPPPGYVRYVFLSQSEQSPNPASRITLSDKRDTLGNPQARMDWRLNELDKRSITIQVRALGAEFARLGLGRVKLADWLLDEGEFWGVRAGNHHMGTTRMGDDPKTSVVDRHCRVHGLANLHVAGSSVFTTSSWANPTLTLVALALRLADRLKGELA